MTQKLAGRHVAVLAADGVDQADLVEPRRAVEDAGATTELLASKEGTVLAVNPADTFPIDKLVSEAHPDDYDALILPGGTDNPGQDAVKFVRSFVDSGKPIGVLCHGPLTLVDAGVLRGRTLRSHPGTSDGRDLPAFCQEIVTEFAEDSR
jgi:protease I